MALVPTSVPHPFTNTFYFITSIAPRRNDTLQQTAILSWLDMPFVRVVSVNSLAEINQFKYDSTLKRLYNGITNHPNFAFHAVSFSTIYNRFYCYINQMINCGKLVYQSLGSKIHTSLVCFINSDIIMGRGTVARNNNLLLSGSGSDNLARGAAAIAATINDPYLRTMQNYLSQTLAFAERYHLVYCRRSDFRSNHLFEPVRRPKGIDVFFCSYHFLHQLSTRPTQFRIGLPYWDFYLPYFAVANKMVVVENHLPLFYHRMHATRWCKSSHNFMRHEFRRVFPSLKKIAAHKLDELVLNQIHSKSIKLNLHCPTRPRGASAPAKRGGAGGARNVGGARGRARGRGRRRQLRKRFMRFKIYRKRAF